MRQRLEHCRTAADSVRQLLRPPIRPAVAGQAAWTPPARGASKSTGRQNLRQCLATAEGLIEKNVRDLPRFIRENEPDEQHVVKADSRAAWIVAAVEEAIPRLPAAKQE